MTLAEKIVGAILDDETMPHVTEYNVTQLPLEQQGQLKHKHGMEYGVTLDQTALPRLEQHYKQASEEMKAAFASGQNAEMLAAFGRLNFFGGALMGASRGQHPISGSNYTNFVQQRQASSTPMKAEFWPTM